MISVSLEIVVRLFFCPNRTFDWFIVSLYNEIKKVGVAYERKEKSFVCGQWGTEHFAT